MKRTTFAVAVCVLATLTMSGCTTVRQDFPDQDPGHVWTAMVAVAETPDYSHSDAAKRWIVRENNVWLDTANSRIEIYRELDRVLDLANADPRRENRTWLFRITLDPTDPPLAEFTSRGWGVPMRARDEGLRYFADVLDLLSGAPSPVAPSEPAVQTQPAFQELPPESSDKPIVDIEELEPTGR